MQKQSRPKWNSVRPGATFFSDASGGQILIGRHSVELISVHYVNNDF